MGCASITRHVNKKYGTSVSTRTVLARMKSGLGHEPPWRGRKPKINYECRNALLRALVSYIQLSNAEGKRKPTRKELIKRLKDCLKDSVCNYDRVDLMFDRLAEYAADKLEVTNKNCNLEHRRWAWTTYKNIDAWFDQLKKFFVDNGFARLREKDDTGSGEIVFLPRQEHRILNIGNPVLLHTR